MRRLAIVPALLVLAACSQPSIADRLVAGQWVDLTYDFDSTTIYWPTAQPFHLTVVSAQRTPGGWYYAANNFSAAEHGGTHLDAPVHFIEKKHTTDQISLSQLVAPAVVIDVRGKADSSPDYRVHQSDITAWEATHGDIPEGSIVDAARALVRRRISAVGIDTPSIDYGQSTTFQVHRRLFASNVPAFENVAHLEGLPATGAFVIALPMKIKGGSGGPLRIVALLP